MSMSSSFSIITIMLIGGIRIEDHKALPGITLGDIGPKAMNGFAAVDHGFARFDQVRIPKSQMLSKFAKVTDEGKYVPAPHAKLSYGGVSDFVLSFEDNRAVLLTFGLG